MQPPVARVGKASAPSVVTDCYESLNEPRRPGIDLASLKSRFLQLSASLHPDRFHELGTEERTTAGEKFAALNAAYQTLLDPKERLRHLYELEAGSRPNDIQKIPPGTMDLFVEIGQSCRDVDTFLAQPGEALAPLVRVQRIRTARDWVARLQGLQSLVNAKRDQLLIDVEAMNSAWISAENITSPDERCRQLPLDRLVEIYRGLSYVGRWTEQVQQRIAELIAVG